MRIVARAAKLAGAIALLLVAAGSLTARRQGTPHLLAGSITVSHAQLAIADGRGHDVATTLDGVNAYQLSSDWAVNRGCGYGGWSDASLDGFFSTFHRGEIVRTWFFQSMADDGARRDWTALDRLVGIAARHGTHLIATLTNQNGQCDDGRWKDTAWYAGGYATQPDGVTPYRTWVSQVVERYAKAGVVSMWEPVNEPEPTDCHSSNCYSPQLCPDPAGATEDLVRFSDDIGGLVHFLDPTALVSDGGFGAGNCGTTDAASYRRVLSAPGIDVDTYHDYTGATAEPGDLAWRTRLDASLGKPMIVEEAGITGCGSAAQRAADFSTKMHDAFGHGVSAYLVWWWGGDGGHPTCDSPVDNDSPTWAMLARHLPQVRPVGPTPAVTTSGLQL